MPIFSTQLQIGPTPGAPPIQVASQVMVPNLNVEMLGGFRAADFAAASHTHAASHITQGFLATARLGSGSATATTFLSTSGGFGLWRNILLSDIPEITAVGTALAVSTTQAAGRAAISAAAAVHTHDALDVVSSVFQIARLGSGAAGSGSKYLRGGPVDASQGQWAQIAASEVSGAARFDSAPISARVPIWTGTTGVLVSSPIYQIPGYIGIKTGTAFAVDDNALFINGVLLPQPPSDGRLYGLRANGGGSTAWETISGNVFGAQAAKSVFAGPTSGAAANPVFRLLAETDIPQIPVSRVTNAVPDSRTVVGGNSLQGGGPLTANLTITLKGDEASPTGPKYYGTNAAGARGYHSLPSSGTAPPNSPDNAAYVWVVNGSASGGDWYQLVGTETIVI